MLLADLTADPVVRLAQRPRGRLADLITEHAPTLADLEQQAVELIAAARDVPEAVADNGGPAVLAALDEHRVDELDLIATVGGAVHRAAELSHTRAVLADVLSAVRTRQGEAFRRAAPAMLRALDIDVRRAVTSLRKSPVTGAGVQTLEAALDAGIDRDLVLAWRDDRTAYHEAFTLAGRVVTALDAEDGNVMRSAHYAVTRVANVEDVWPDHAVALAGIGNRHQTRPPWQRDPHADSQSRDPNALLDWLVATPDAKPVLATPDAIAERKQQLRPAISAAVAAAEKAWRADPSRPRPNIGFAFV